jgi:hypothetical protein
MPTLLPPLSKERRSMMNNELIELLRAFNAHAVKYLIVGTYAFGIHVEPRATKGMDLFIRSDEENFKAVFRALAQFGAPLGSFPPADFTDDTVFQIGQPPARIDIMQDIDGISFNEAWESSVEGLLDVQTPVHVISREHLIQNKLAAGRYQDLADVEKLRESALEG